MENDKYISLLDSYIETNGDGKEVAKSIDNISNGKIKIVISTKSLPKTPVNQRKRIRKES